MNREVAAIWLELIEAGVFIALDKSLPEDRLAKLSPSARAFYDYYRQALPHNPVFRDPYTPASDSVLYSPYRSNHHQSVPKANDLLMRLRPAYLMAPINRIARTTT